MAVALIAIALGALLLWIGLRNRKRVRASMGWPYAAGRVVASSVRESVSQGDENTADSYSYTPVVQYEYQVGAQVYQGNRLSFQDKSYNNPKQAHAALEAYPVGGPVWVFHDPANPQSCVLDRTAHANAVPLILGAILLLAGLVGLLKS